LGLVEFLATGATLPVGWRQEKFGRESAADGIVVPRVIADAGDQAARRFLEFFAATIRNKNTRMAYYRAVCDFFSWCDRHRIGGIADVEPMHVAAYIENLQHAMSKPTAKQHLTAIRMLFDWLVTGQVVATNPAHSVRGPKHVVKTDKTTVLDADQARKLLDSTDTSTVVGLRDRALISVMTFAFARIGAVVAMRVEDYYPKRKALVGPPARKRRQTPRDADASQPGSLSRRLYRGGRHTR
jgi:site-specific recombinase XerD